MVVLTSLVVIGSAYISLHAAEWVRSWLSEQYKSDVDLKTFDVSIPFPLVQAKGEGLILHFKGRPELPPLIAIDRFTVRTSFWGLIRGRKNIEFVRLEGFRINIPPRSTTASSSDARSGIRKFVGKIRAVRFREIISDNAVLRILTTKPGKDPLTFDIKHLTLSSTDVDGQLAFHAKLTNPTPPGEIDSTGIFGPWNPDTPSLTPVSGNYTFENADLGVFRGIQGTLSSKGNYWGALEEIQAEGSTETPNFQITRVGHPVSLSTKYQATVDGTDGDTYLHPVEVRFRNTALICEGNIEGTSGKKGKTITLNVSTENAKIEDLLELAVKQQSLMSGPIRLKTKYVLEPGHEEIMERLKLDGSFELDSVHFTNSTVQQRLDNMSKRSLGKPSQVVSPQNATRMDDIASGMIGRFRLDRATLTLSSLKFEIPGALVQLHGNYRVDAEELDLHGTLAMRAKLSQTVTGIKSFLLKPLDPFFSKHGNGTFLPIKITGPPQHPRYGPDFGHKETADKSQ